MSSTPPKPKKVAYVQPFYDEAKKGRYRVTGANGEIMQSGQAYKTMAGATRAAKEFCEHEFVFEPRGKTRSAK